MALGDDNQLENHVYPVNTDDDDDDELRLSLSVPDSTDQQSIPSTNKTHREKFDDDELNKLYDDWFSLDADLRAFEPKHKDYVRKLDEVESLKSKYKSEFLKYQKKIEQLQKDLNRLKKSGVKQSRVLARILTVEI